MTIPNLSPTWRKWPLAFVLFIACVLLFAQWKANGGPDDTASYPLEQGPPAQLLEHEAEAPRAPAQPISQAEVSATPLVFAEGPAREPAAKTEQLLELDASSLLVKVLDANGVPAGSVPVILVSRMVGGAHANRWHPQWTDEATGIARISVSELQKEQHREALAALGLEYLVEARVPLVEPVKALLEGIPEPGDKALLQLPPTGAIEVEALDHQGKPLTAPARIRISYQKAGASDPAWLDLPSGVKLVNGIGRLERVGLGLAFDVSVTGADFARGHTHPSGSRSDVASLQGPVKAAEIVRATVRAGAPYTQVRIRLVDEEGTPFSRVRAEIVMRASGQLAWTSPSRLGGERRSVDANGFVQWRIRTQGDGPKTFEVVAPASRADMEEGRSQAAVLEVPDGLEAGAVHDFGSLTLRPPPFAITGQVVDDEGLPIPDAKVTLARELQSEVFAFHGDRSNLQGQFQFGAWSKEIEYPLVAYAPNFENGSPVGAAAGTAGVQLVLKRRSDPGPRGAFEYRVQHEPGSLPLYFGLYWSQLEGSGGGSTELLPTGDRNAKISSVPVGTFTVRVIARNGGWEAIKVEGVVIEENQTTSDARLMPMDLGGAAKLVTLDFKRSDTQPLKKCRLRIKAEGVEGVILASVSDKGRTHFAVPSTSRTCTARHDDGRAVDVTFAVNRGEPQIVIFP